MRLTNKLLKDTIVQEIGEEAYPIVEALRKQDNLSEFVIAENLDYDIHLVRHLLYKMHDHNLVTYIRKKDRQKGWYISYWTFNPKRVKEMIKRLKEQRLDKLQERLEKEESNKNYFFMCRNACIRLDVEQAMNFEFKCPECGSLLEQQENAKTIENIKDRINELSKELAKMG
ncbi:MAG: hypothetical protein ACQEP1_06335 [Nanobdellota archaeon]